MATHPFAQKLEIALEHAKRVRDSLLAAKDAADKAHERIDTLLTRHGR